MARNKLPPAVFIARNIFTGETETIYGLEGLEHKGYHVSTVYKCLRGELSVHKERTWSKGYPEDMNKLNASGRPLL